MSPQNRFTGCEAFEMLFLSPCTLITRDVPKESATKPQMSKLTLRAIWHQNRISSDITSDLTFLRVKNIHGMHKEAHGVPTKLSSLREDI